MSPTEKCAVVLLFTGVAAPIAGACSAASAGGWDSLGKGAFAIEQRPRPVASATSRLPPRPSTPPSRRRRCARCWRRSPNGSERRGETPIDVEAETARLLTPVEAAPTADTHRQDAELRAEVRQLVVGRNERRMRRGLEPLDVEAETERQLADFVGSR